MLRQRLVPLSRRRCRRQVTSGPAATRSAGDGWRQEGDESFTKPSMLPRLPRFAQPCSAFHAAIRPVLPRRTACFVVMVCPLRNRLDHSHLAVEAVTRNGFTKMCVSNLANKVIACVSGDLQARKPCRSAGGCKPHEASRRPLCAPPAVRITAPARPSRRGRGCGSLWPRPGARRLLSRCRPGRRWCAPPSVCGCRPSR